VLPRFLTETQVAFLDAAADCNWTTVFQNIPKLYLTVAWWFSCSAIWGPWPILACKNWNASFVLSHETLTNYQLIVDGS